MLKRKKPVCANVLKIVGPLDARSYGIKEIEAVMSTLATFQKEMEPEDTIAGYSKNVGTKIFDFAVKGEIGRKVHPFSIKCREPSHGSRTDAMA